MTEKNYNPQQRQKKSMKKQEKVQKTEIADVFKKEESKIVENKKEEKIENETRPSVAELEKKEVKKTEVTQKKTNAVVNGFNIPVSTKHSAAICRFIKRKKIQQAIKELEQVVAIRKSIPMKGEIPHRKGNIMSGRFPEKAAKQFIILLKSLSSNATHNGLENPIIVEAVANIGARPFGRSGVRRKRTHIKIVAENKIKKEGKK
jgi:ribosomal protein L22